MLLVNGLCQSLAHQNSVNFYLPGNDSTKKLNFARNGGGTGEVRSTKYFATHISVKELLDER